MGDLKRKQYEELLEPLQQELAAAARWVAATGQRLVIIFEGRDTAGKGGAIQAISEQLNPRQCRTVRKACGPCYHRRLRRMALLLRHVCGSAILPRPHL